MTARWSFLFFEFTQSKLRFPFFQDLSKRKAVKVAITARMSAAGSA
jgi:hypothetical protein